MLDVGTSWPLIIERSHKNEELDEVRPLGHVRPMKVHIVESVKRVGRVAGEAVGAEVVAVVLDFEATDGAGPMSRPRSRPNSASRSARAALHLRA